MFLKGEAFQMAISSWRKALAASTLVLVAAGCAHLGWKSGPKGPSDANIAAILLAANNTDISYARLAPNRAQSPAIKDFAARMLTDHNAVNAMVNELLGRINLTPEEN